MAQPKIVVQKLELPFPPQDNIPIKIPVSLRTKLVSYLKSQIASIFEQFGGGTALLKSSRDVYIKPNGIDAKPYAYTRPEVLEALIRYFQDCGANQIYIFENSTQSNYTRIVFEGTGFKRVCKRTGATPLYLDEEKTTRFAFSDHDYDLDHFYISETIYDKLIIHKEENLYINLPKLKTHSMSGVTLGIKNQWAFPRHVDRKFDHNYQLHSKLVDVLAIITPDFTLIEGMEGTIHGHYPASALVEDSVVPFRLLIGGRNVFATDWVGTKIFGLTLDDVPHLKLVKQKPIFSEIANFEFADIEIVGDLSPYTNRYPYDIIPTFPPNVNIVSGKDLWCKEGCQNNPLMLLQVLYLDYSGKGTFDLVAGKGFDHDQIDHLKGPVLICGHCAWEEIGDRLVKRLGKKKIYYSDGCNNLAQTAAAMLKLLHVNPLKLVPVNPIKAVWLLFLAKLHGSQANVPSVLSKWIKTN